MLLLLPLVLQYIIESIMAFESIYTCMIEFVIINGTNSKKKNEVCSKTDHCFKKNILLQLVMPRLKFCICFTDALNKICQ